jgi:hypothetical protein
VTTVAVRLAGLTRVETVRVALIAAVPAVLLVLLGPPGGDVPAHLYRTLLVREGVFLWDNLWYGGQYPLVSYSLLYYLPAAVVGNVPLVVGAVLLSAVLFATICTREWGVAALWPARVFGVLSAGPLFTGTYSYALGLAALLGTLRALQAGSAWIAAACAALTLGFSPLAFLFLCLVLAAVFMARRRMTAKIVSFGSGVGVAVALEALAIWLFPTDGRYPFRSLELAAVLTVSVLGGLLALRARRGAALAAFFALWGVASVAVFVLPSPVGENFTRLRSVVFPVMLLTALLAGFRPRLLAASALVFAFAYNVVPYAAVIPERVDSRPARESFWRPALAFLRAHSSPDYRIEVVPTFDHWEAYWVPRAGFALARGWYRQIDIAQNPVLYRKTLTPDAYRSWLRRMGVRYVLLSRAHLGTMGAEREADLLSSGRAGLAVAFESADWTIYELPAPLPILTGPASARLLAFGHDRIAGRLARSGEYLLRVRYTPYWTVVAGDVCLAPLRDGEMTRLWAGGPGRFALSLPEGPRVVRSAFGDRVGRCGA